ncbi:hypothetical protein [Aquiflexum lacus]|uniref:hypothetical protein n=1 Tax=Aquiflexum lacus TaxID=2483805 RepID=UPI001893C09A|nr:hypothetical protein [Aquiflexum lacus]
MQAMTKKQLDVLYSHTGKYYWRFDSYERSRFNFMLQNWVSHIDIESDPVISLSLSFTPNQGENVGPKLLLREIEGMSQSIYLNSDINWVEREAPDYLNSYWDFDCWLFLQDRIKSSMRYRVASIIEYALCTPQKLLSLGIPASRQGVTLGQLVKLASFSTKNELMNVPKCGDKAVNAFLDALSDGGLMIDPNLYRNGNR